MTHRNLWWLVASLLASSAALADSDAGTTAAAAKIALPAPSALEVKKVLDYYFGAKGQGPILVELKLCSKVDGSKDSPTRAECTEEATGPIFKKGTLQVWSLWLVPEGDAYEDVTFQYVHDGVARSTFEVPLKAAYRTRVWRPMPLTKSGKWEVKVLRAGKELASLKLNVE